MQVICGSLQWADFGVAVGLTWAMVWLGLAWLGWAWLGLAVLGCAGLGWVVLSWAVLWIGHDRRLGLGFALDRADMCWAD